MNRKIKILLIFCINICYSQILEYQKNVECNFNGDTTIFLFDENKDTSRIFSLTNGQLDGKFVDFVNGVKRLECCFTNGKLNGVCLNFDKRGRLLTITWFDDGCIMGGRVFYSNGKLKSVLLPSPEKDIFKGEIRYNKKGKESHRFINERPLEYYFFGNKYFKSGC